MLQLLRQCHKVNDIILNQEFHKDLNWFCVFLQSFNGITIYDLEVSPECIYLDAPLPELGGCFNNMEYAIGIFSGFREYTILHLEMVNMIVALKLWDPLWANKRIRIQCDHQAMVDVLSTGRARHGILATCACNVLPFLFL